MIEKLSMIPDNQFGFRKTHITDIQLCKVVETILGLEKTTARVQFTGCRISILQGLALWIVKEGGPHWHFRRNNKINIKFSWTTRFSD